MAIISAAGTASESKPAARDIATVIAISVVAFAITNVVHEGGGHGGACLLSGGQARLLTSVNFDCSFDSRFISAGGTIANLIMGVLGWAALRAAKRASGALRFFLWLLMSINLMTAAGYWFFSGTANIGDWSDVIRGLHPAWAWHVALAVFGLVTYSLVVWFALRELRPLLSDRDLRRGGAKDLTIVPYLTGGLLHVLSGLLNPVSMWLVVISAAAVSFGGTSGLAWMTQYLRPRSSETNRVALRRSWEWIAAGCVVTALFIGVLGPGVKF